MIAPLTHTEAVEHGVGPAQDVARRYATESQRTFDSVMKSSAEKAKEPQSFAPEDLVECIEGHQNNWPLETGKVYMVAIDVIAGFNHKGPASGVILDPCPNRHGVSNGPAHPYVWDSERFIFFSHPRPVQQTFVQRPLVAPLEPYGFD